MKNKLRFGSFKGKKILQHNHAAPSPLQDSSNQSMKSILRGGGARGGVGPGTGREGSGTSRILHSGTAQREKLFPEEKKQVDLQPAAGFTRREPCTWNRRAHLVEVSSLSVTEQCTRFKKIDHETIANCS